MNIIFLISHQHYVRNKQIRLNYPGFSKLKSMLPVLPVQVPHITCLGTAQFVSLQNQESTGDSLELALITILNLFSEKILTLVYEEFSDDSCCLDMCHIFPYLQHYFYDLSEIGITRDVVSHQLHWFSVLSFLSFFNKVFWCWNNKSQFL